MVTKAARGYLTGAVLLAIIFWGSGCAQQEQLRALINMPGQLEEASLIAYRSSLELCAIQVGAQSEPLGTGIDSCRANVKASFKPLIELFEKAHVYYCQVVPEHEVCKP